MRGAMLSVCASGAERERNVSAPQSEAEKEARSGAQEPQRYTGAEARLREKRAMPYAFVMPFYFRAIYAHIRHSLTPSPPVFD